MVQKKKSPNKLKPQKDDSKKSESNKSDKKQQEQEQEQQQQQDGKKMKGPVVDLKRMMKRARSIKLLEGDLLKDKKKTPTPQKNKSAKPSSASSSSSQKNKHSPIDATAPERSPNYMKPTSSSGARKDRSHETSKASKTSTNSNSSRPSSSSTECSGGAAKSSKALVKRLSLRLISPWMKKSSEIVVVNPAGSTEVRKPTCSSTLKDSKFPKNLKLNPGGSEAEGTSVFKVCPYHHCSLNGHHHKHDEPVPSLKRVISVRRRVLKTQKSGRLKGLASFKVRGSRKSRGEVHREVVITRVPSMKAPLIEEVGDDYFVKVYAPPQSQAIDIVSFNNEDRIQEEFDSEILKVIEGLSLEGDERQYENVYEVEGLSLEGGDEKHYDNMYEFHEFGLEMGYEDDKEWYSELSIGEMDVVMDFLEYIEGDQEVQAEEEGYHRQCTEDFAEQGFGYSVMRKEVEELEVSLANASNLEAAVSALEEEERLKYDYDAHLCEYLDHELYEDLLMNEHADGSHEYREDHYLVFSEAEGVVDLQQDLNFGDEKEISKVDPSSSLEYEQSEAVNGVVDQGSGAQECQKKEFELDSGTDNLQLRASSTLKDDEFEMPIAIVDKKLNASNLEPVRNMAEEDEHREEDRKNCNGSEAHFIVEEAEFEASASPPRSSLSMVAGMGNTILALENEEKENRLEEFVEDDDGNSMIKIQFSCSPQGFYEIDMEYEDMSANSTELSADAENRPKARYNYIRRRTTEDVQDMQQFNPRAPNFLPEVPDAEREKVDLRHQLMEERKNAEEWMVDHTLQRTVSRLARARSRKVRLFVEAFETVMQPPMHERYAQDSVPGLDQRRIQQCS